MMTALLTLLVCLLLAVSSAISACTYVNILTQPGQVLDFWARWLYRLRDKYVGTTPNEFDEGDEGPERAEYYAIRYEHANYLLKPILTCVYCVAGQLGFWLSVYVFYSYSISFNLIFSLLTSALSIYLAGAFQALQQRHFPL